MSTRAIEYKLLQKCVGLITQLDKLNKAKTMKNNLYIDVKSSTFNPCGAIDLILYAHWASLSLRRSSDAQPSII